VVIDEGVGLESKGNSTKLSREVGEEGIDGSTFWIKVVLR